MPRGVNHTLRSETSWRGPHLLTLCPGQCSGPQLWKFQRSSHSQLQGSSVASSGMNAPLSRFHLLMALPVAVLLDVAALEARLKGSLMWILVLSHCFHLSSGNEAPSVKARNMTCNWMFFI
jgi:hypothetical protein